ncbi:MAG: NUDIX hydrolase [Candidatus Pacebacteria bacterium]|nr:NUDIX hydrolase [Candidatus Paceibacterota bacterium]
MCTSGIIIRQGKVLLGNRLYDDADVWISPGGRCEDGESPEAALLRELVEEIGVSDARIVCRLGEKNGAYKDTLGRDRVMVFKVFTTQEPRLMEPQKFREWKWFGLDELPKNLLDPADADFFTAALKMDHSAKGGSRASQ